MKAMLVCVSCGKPCAATATRCAGCGNPILHRVTERFAVDAVLAVSPDVVTYKTVDRVLHRAAVVYLARPKAGEAAKDRLATEARLLRKHEGAGLFPSFLSAGKLPDTGAVFIAVEFVEGMTLAEACAKARSAEMLDLYLQAAELIARAHALGIILLNIKPEHFRLTPEGEMRLVDLKCAREPGAPCHGLGAKGLRAPESYIKLEPATTAMDAFALAAMLYVLLTSRLPYFAKKSSREPAFDKPLTPASTLNPVVPPELDEIIVHGLAVHPERRFSNAAALRDALFTHYARRTRLDVAPLTTVTDRAVKSKPRDAGKDAGKRTTATGGGAAAPMGGAWRMPYAVPPYVPPISAPGTFWDFVSWVLGIAACLVITVLCVDSCRERREASAAYTPASVARDVGESIVRFLSYPAAKVFVNGKLLSEAPSLDDVACPSGSASFRIISNTGKEHSFSTWLAPGRTYEVRTDVDDATHSVQEVGR